MGVEVRSHKGPEKKVMDYPVEKVDITKLIPHEQTIAKELDWFVNSVQDSDAVIWPLLIAKESHLILDGHHRSAGLKQLDYDYVPAVLIDYSDDDLIQLDTWYPNIHKSADEILAVIREDEGIDIEAVEDNEFNQEKLDKREITAFLGTKSELYSISCEREVLFKQIRDNWINEITYYDDPEMCLDNTDKDHTAVIAWSYTKDEILEHVKKGIVHLPKTTRHTLKYRVPEVNFPLKDLKE